MVLQRTIDNLKERPHHERHTIALSISVFVALLLLVGWAFLFFRNLGVSNPQEFQETYNRAIQSATPPPNVTGWVSEAPTQVRPVTITTQGDMQLIEESAPTTTIEYGVE